MNFIKRILTHLAISEKAVHKLFSAATMNEIALAISESEKTHSGEVRFAVEHALHLPDLMAKVTSRQRALDVFSSLRIWDTEKNNGVLIYLLLADKSVEIIADRGIHEKVGEKEWNRICNLIEANCKQGKFKDGVMLGLHEISTHLKNFFPPIENDINELDNTPVIL